jgi:hypothetical protein
MFPVFISSLLVSTQWIVQVRLPADYAPLNLGTIQRLRNNRLGREGV